MVTCFNYLLNNAGMFSYHAGDSDLSTLESRILESVFLTNT